MKAIFKALKNQPSGHLQIVKGRFSAGLRIPLKGLSPIHGKKAILVSKGKHNIQVTGVVRIERQLKIIKWILLNERILPPLLIGLGVSEDAVQSFFIAVKVLYTIGVLAKAFLSKDSRIELDDIFRNLHWTLLTISYYHNNIFTEGEYHD